MKTFNLFSKFFVSILLLGSFAVSGWGADECGGMLTNSDFSKNPLVSGTPYTQNESVGNNSTDTYYFKAPSDGNVTITLTNIQNEVHFSSNLTACPGTAGNKTTQTITLSGDLDFNIEVYKTTSANNIRAYTITVTFTPNSIGSVPTFTENQDMCYDAITYAGDIFGIPSCVSSGTFQGGVNCTQTIPIRNISESNLTSVNSYLDIDGLSGSVYSSCGVDDAPGNCSSESSINIGLVSALKKGIKYILPDYTSDASHSIYETSSISGAIFSGTNLYATYTKNGTLYSAQLSACPVLAPDLNITKTASVSSATVSTDYTYTIRVGNQGTALADNVTVTDTLPSGVTYKSFSGTGWSYTASPQKWTYSSLANGVIASDLVITVTASSTAQAVGANTATVSTTTTESNTANNTATSGTVTIVDAGVVTKPDGQCGIFPSVLTSYDSITVSGNNAQVCSEQDLAYPTTGSNLGSLQCNASGCGNGACSRIDPPNIQYTVTFPTLPIASTTLSSDQTLTPTQTYSGGTSHEYSTFGDTTISGANGRTITFTAGDYYFNSLTLPDSNSQIIISGGAVRIFVKNNLTFNGNSFEINKNGLAGNLFIYVGGDLSFAGNGGGKGGMNAYFYTEGTTIVKNNTDNFQLTGGITSEGPIKITGNNPSFHAYTLGAGNGYGDCNTPIDYTLTGPFDAWDTFRSVSDRNISTKVVNTAFNLTVAALNSAKTGLEAKASGVKARYRLLNTNTAAYLTNEQIFDANATASITSSFNAASASKNVKVEFKYCADYNGTHFILKPDTSCSADCSPQLKVTNNAPCFRKTYSTDAFALRPYALKVFGSNQYKRAGEDFNITVKAVDETNNALNSGAVNVVNGVDDYNASLSDLEITSMFYTPTTAEMTTMQSHTGLTDVATCPNSGTFTLVNPSALFVDGEQNATLKFNETGILDLYISENIGHEWAIVDADDTSDSNRTISPSINSFDKTDISENTILAFVPYGFVTTADYNTTTGADWIYMHDINGSNSTLTTPKMGAYLSYSITAKGKDGNVLQNYTKTCFPDTDDDCPQVNGLKLNTTFDLYLNADINSSADANISLYTEDNASLAIHTPQKNAAIAVGSNAIQEWTSPKIFTNGIGKAKVYFNIDRKANVALNPITLRVEDVNTSTSWMLNAGSPRDFNGTILNTPKNFVYGRTHAAKQRYIKPDGTNTTTGDANIYFESYCFGAGCNKTLLPNGTASKNVDDIRWFMNQNHNIANDGNVSIVVQKGGANTSADSVTAPDNSTGNPSTAQLTYSGGKGYPYKTTMQNGASPWLIFDENNATATRNEFQVEFSGEASWSGKHETNTTTKTDQSIRTNRRITW